MKQMSMFNRLAMTAGITVAPAQTLRQESAALKPDRTRLKFAELYRHLRNGLIGIPLVLAIGMPAHAGGNKCKADPDHTIQQYADDDLSCQRSSRAAGGFIQDVVVRTSNGAALLINNQNERNDSFNRAIERNGKTGKITQCKILIDVPVGTAHGNHSYGGFCTLVDGSASNVIICDDDMVGHFKMEPSDRKPTMQRLVDFVAKNCYGG